jgi:1-acyl-sn-glycerol-3-phosphate acyltransferase
MLSRLPRPLIATIVIVVASLSTIAHTSTLFVFALFKLIIPIPAFTRFISRVLIVIAESWIGVNSAMIEWFSDPQWRVQGLEGLSREGWYLVLSNHQSWVDILVLQRVFNRRIPFLKFFLKSQLIWVPLLGLAWWALDFPFMKRYSKEHLERNPHLRGKDIEATRRACAKFATVPVSVMNFVEGTRFTPAKHARQQSPYPHLLRPKAGGVAFVLDTMGELLQAIVDVTIVYPRGRPTMKDLVTGRVREVDVYIRRLPIPADLIGGSYESDPAYRERFQTWINRLWEEKNAVLEQFVVRRVEPPAQRN